MKTMAILDFSTSKSRNGQELMKLVLKNYQEIVGIMAYEIKKCEGPVPVQIITFFGFNIELHERK